MDKFTFYSSNKFKKQVWKDYLNTCDLNTLEIQGTAEEIVRNKCKNLPPFSIVEDVSLYIEDLNGLPGPYIKYYFDKLPKIANGSNATAVCLVAAKFEDCTKIFSGQIKGTIELDNFDKNTFGFNSIFKLQNGIFLQDSKISHRTEAINSFIDYVNIFYK